MASWKKNYFNVPAIKVTDCNVPERKSRYPMPVRTCDMDLPGLCNKKTATPKPFKFQPIRWKDMDLPELKTNKPKTLISKPTKSTDKAKSFTPIAISSRSTSKNLDSDPKPHRHVRKQLWSDKKNQNKLNIKMKPERRTTITAKSIIPKGVIELTDITPLIDLKKFEKNPNIFKIQSNKIKDTAVNHLSIESLISQKFNELNNKIDMHFKNLAERIEKLELKCNCNVKNDKISTPPITKKTKFEILEQKLQRESPMPDELSLSDTDSPIVEQEINSLIHDKSAIKKSYSTSNLAETTKKSVRFTSANDVRSTYEEIRSDASFLCTPKNTTKVKNLMTPSVKGNNKKLISRTIQKQLLLLDDN